MTRVTSVTIHPLLLTLGKSHAQLALRMDWLLSEWSHKQGRVYSPGLE
jgi:hypothetical protein